jgi:hypothetical protein
MPNFFAHISAFSHMRFFCVFTHALFLRFHICAFSAFSLLHLHHLHLKNFFLRKILHFHIWHFLHKYATMLNTDINNIFNVYLENATTTESHPEQDADGNVFWRLPNLKLHRIGAPAIEWANGTKQWFLNGKLHRTGAPATMCPNGTNFWYQHGKLHRDDAPAVEWADGTKEWYLNGNYYEDVNQWAQAVLKMHNKPHDAAAAEDYLRTILTKDDLI